MTFKFTIDQCQFLSLGYIFSNIKNEDKMLEHYNNKLIYLFLSHFCSQYWLLQNQYQNKNIKIRIDSIIKIIAYPANIFFFRNCFDNHKCKLNQLEINNIDMITGKA